MTLTKIKTGGIQDDAVTSGKIPANAVGSSELADNAVDTAAIADQAVTLAKLEHGTSSNSGKFLRANNGADPTFETVNTDMVSDTSPQLGGDVDTNGNNINFRDSSATTDDRARFGDSFDLQIYHNGTDSYIDNENGYLYVNNDSSGIRLISGNSWPNGKMAAFYADGASELYYDNSKKLSTVTNGIQAHGNFLVQDGYQVRLGNDNDAQLYHSGSNLFLANTTGYIRMSSSNAIYLDGNGIFLRNAAGNEDFLKCQNNGAVELYHDNTKRAETYSNGFKVGNVTIDSTTGGSIFGSDSSRGGVHFSPNAVLPSNSSGAVPDNTIALGSGSARWSSVYATTFYGDGSNLTGISSVGGATGVTFNDGVFAKFGTDSDLKIYHNNTDGQMVNSTGNLILANSTDGDIFIDPKNNERGIVVKPDAGVELYYNNSAQLYTVDGGIAVGINARLNGAKGTFANDGTHLSLRSFATGGYDSIIFRSANTTVGRIHFNSGGTQYHTSSDYRRKQNIVNLTGAINRIKGLKPKRFNFIAEPDVTRDGFLAHEVTAVPEAILGTKDQVATEKDVEEGKANAVGDPIYQTIDQSALVPLLTAAIKELISRVEVLEAA